MQQLSLLAILLALLILPGATAYSQTLYEEVPEKERDLCFLYTEFKLPGTEELKVVVFSGHLFRYKYSYGYSHPVLGMDGFHTRLINRWNLRINEIKNNEHNSQASIQSNQVMPVKTRHEWSFNNSGIAEATGPELYLTLSSSTELLDKVREHLIEDYRRRGYIVFQTGFEAYYDEGIDIMKLESIRKLSPLYVEEYHTGDIRSLARSLQENSSSSNKKSSTTEENKDNYYELLAFMAKERDQLRSYFLYIEARQGHVSGKIDGEDKEVVIQRFLNLCQRYIDDFGYHKEVDDMMKQAHSWTLAGQAAFLAENAPRVIADLAKVIYVQFEYSKFFPNPNASPKDAYQIYIGYPFRSSIDENAFFQSAALSLLRHPTRHYIREYERSGQMDTMENTALKSFTTGWRFGSRPKLAKWLCVRIESDVHLSIDTSEDAEESPRPGLFSVMINP